MRTTIRCKKHMQNSALRMGSERCVYVTLRLSDCAAANVSLTSAAIWSTSSGIRASPFHCTNLLATWWTDFTAATELPSPSDTFKWEFACLVAPDDVIEAASISCVCSSLKMPVLVVPASEYPKTTVQVKVLKSEKYTRSVSRTSWFCTPA